MTVNGSIPVFTLSAWTLTRQLFMLAAQAASLAAAVQLP